jgi:pyruvate dehydrogenase E2 component (dihydrolipoamide acetyltransferase)
MAEFLMPSLGADMLAGTLVEWRVKPGDHVSRGDVVALVETDKGILDLEIFETGVIERMLVQGPGRHSAGDCQHQRARPGATSDNHARTPSPGLRPRLGQSLACLPSPGLRPASPRGRGGLSPSPSSGAPSRSMAVPSPCGRGSG